MDDAADRKLLQEGLQTYIDAMACIKSFRFLLMDLCKQILKDHIPEIAKSTKQKFDTKRLFFEADPYGPRSMAADENWDGGDAWLGAWVRPATSSSKIAEIHLGVWLGKEDNGDGVDVYACAYMYFQGKTEALELHERWAKKGAELDDYGVGFSEEVISRRKNFTVDKIRRPLVKALKKLISAEKDLSSVIRKLNVR
jgi:hypothetical protein